MSFEHDAIECAEHGLEDGIVSGVSGAIVGSIFPGPGTLVAGASGFVGGFISGAAEEALHFVHF